MAHRAAHNAAQNVATTVVGRHHTIRDKERGRTQVVRDHTVMRFTWAVWVNAGGVGRCFNQSAHQVGIVVVMLALKQRANPFQPHACVDGLHVQRFHRAIFELFVLHENDVPNFDETVAVFLWRTRRATPDVIAVIVENLGARTARTSRPHLPEVIRGRNADDAILRNADFFPNLKRFVVGMVDGRQKTFGIDVKIFGDQFPSERNSFVLEIVTKGEVPEHFKERVVARRVANVIKVVVFAPCPHAFLRCRRAHVIALFNAGKTVLELHHARVREHQGRVVARNQRRRRNDGVTIPFEIAEEGRADIRKARHGGP